MSASRPRPTGIPARAAGLRPRTAGLPARDRPSEPAAERKEALAWAHRAVEFAADKKAADIVLLDVSALTTLADYFVICSGASERQLTAVAEGVVEGLEQGGAALIAREGSPGSHWLLLDFGAVIVHVMARSERDFYQLERLWAAAPMVLRVQ